MSRRPSIASSVASARTLPPTAVGARWSSCTRYPTLVVPSASSRRSRAPIASSARVTTAASRARARRRSGVASAVSSSRDDELDGSGQTGAQTASAYDRQPPAGGWRRFDRGNVIEEASPTHAADRVARTVATSPRCSPRIAGWRIGPPRRRQGRGARLRSRARRRHPGRPRRHHRLRPHRRSERAGPGEAAAEAAAAAARGTAGATHVVALERRDGRRPPTRSGCCRSRSTKARKAEVLERADARRPRRERLDPPGQRHLRRRPPPDPRRQLRRPARRGRPRCARASS